MTESTEQLKRALRAIQDLKREVNTLRSEKHEPIAIVGIGCRFPGNVNSLDSYWDLLRNGVDAISEIPRDRWPVDEFFDSSPDAKGKMSVKHGGFLSGIDQFDAEFFGLSPREAAYMDPQQRVLMEVVWQCLEDAMIPNHTLRNQQGGVFLGISGADYSQMLIARDPKDYDMYMGSGNAHSVAAGRVSYWLGMQGPCVAIDTACSSSLTAVHLACKSLRTRECSIALAGGVNLILTPTISINHSRAKMLSPDGRCKAFAASADGFSRAEGCGVIALKRLSDAQANGDRIVAVIRGSATNQDGKTSGITVPNAFSQERLIRDALHDARLTPSEIDYIEAHGTGTALGDPIEVEALQAVFQESHSIEQPLPVGSVKSNIGHTEAAAGIAGLIKTALCLMKNQLPPTLHCDELNPRIDWQSSPVRPVVDHVSLQAKDEPHRAGVSSFGFGGSNAHIVLEEAPPSSVETKPWPGATRVFPLSARTPEALQALADSYVDHPFAESDLNNACRSVATGRSHFNERIAVTGQSASEIIEGLSAKRETIAVNQATATIAFLFTGQGSQFVGMGKLLRQHSPFVESELQKSNEILSSLLGCSILDVIDAVPGSADLHQTAYTQPALVALEVAIARLWMHWGVVPEVVMGHSVGEYSAAIIAGIVSLEDGLRLIAERARLMQSLPAGGGMIAVLAARDQVEPLLARIAPSLSIASYNGPRNTVVSGSDADLQRLSSELDKQQIDYRPLKVSHAFHSSLMEPILDTFEQAARQITYHPPELDCVSNCTGQIETDAFQEAAYWRDHIRQPVEFNAGMKSLSDSGVNVYLEVGPNPVLCGMGRYCVESKSAAWLPTLRERDNDWDTIADTLATLYEAGANLNWTRVYEPFPATPVSLPTYPFQRERHWIDTTDHLRLPGTSRVESTWLNPLLEKRIECAHDPDATIYQTTIDTARFPYLNDHVVWGEVLVPGSVFLEMIRAALNESGGGKRTLNDVQFIKATTLSPNQSTTVQVVLSPLAQDGDSVTIYVKSGTVWEPTVRSTASPISQSLDAPADMQALKQRMRGSIDPIELYANYKQRGVEFGPAFQAIEEINIGDGECLARLNLPNDVHIDSSGIHPVLIDACAQSFGALCIQDSSNDIYLQSSISQYQGSSKSFRSAWCHVQGISRTAGHEITFTCALLNDEGTPLARLHEVTVHRANAGSLHKSSAIAEAYTIEWLPHPDIESEFGLPIPEEVTVKVEPSLRESAENAELKQYLNLLDELDAISLACMQNYLLDAFPNLNEQTSITPAALMEAMKITPRFDRLIQRWFMWLQNAGLLKPLDDKWVLAHPIQPVDLHAVFDRLHAQYSVGQTEIGILQSFTDSLRDILQGTCDPVTLLFSDGDDADAEAMYRDSPGARLMNASLAQVVDAMAAASAKPLRILELGGGVGGATSYLLPLIEKHDIAYTFSDVSPRFITQARMKFHGYSSLGFKVVDIEQNPVEQGLEAESFDLVVAFNVLHATRDLNDTLRHVRSLLCPGGQLVMMENAVAVAWVELVWGTLDGWWRFTDTENRADQPLLSESRWNDVLTANGFGAIAAISPRQMLRNDQFTQSILIAENAGTQNVPVKTILCCDPTDSGNPWFANPDDSTVRIHPPTNDGKRSPTEIEFSLLDQTGQSNTTRLRVILLCTPPLSATDSMDGESINAEANRSSQWLVNVIQACLPYRGKMEIEFCVITQGVYAHSVGDPSPGIVHAPLWGLLRTAVLEYPDIDFRLIDLPTAPTPSDWQHARKKVEERSSVDQWMLRDGQWHSAQVSPVSLTNEVVSIAPDATILIVGGFGALGQQAAQHLIDNGARNLVLIGRHGATTDAVREEIDKWRAQGVTIREEKCNVADSSSLNAALLSIRASMPSLRGVIFAAGRPGYKPLVELSSNDLSDQFEAKVQGSWNLHQATLNDSLDFFVVFSSMVSLWGASGQSHYVASNHFLDCLVAYRRAQGHPATAINWGPIEGGGMLPDEIVNDLSRMGVSTTPLESSMAPFASMLAMDAAYAAPVSIDWKRFLGLYEARKSRPFFDSLRSSEAPAQEAAPVQTQSLQEQLQSVPAPLRRGKVNDHIRSRLVEVLCLDASRTVKSDQGFFDMGMDSLTAMELKNTLETDVGKPLPSTLAFDYSTMASLTAFLVDECKLIQSAEETKPEVQATEATDDDLETMSDEEAEQLLLRKLEGLDGKP